MPPPRVSGVDYVRRRRAHRLPPGAPVTLFLAMLAVWRRRNGVVIRFWRQVFCYTGIVLRGFDLWRASLGAHEVCEPK